MHILWKNCESSLRTWYQNHWILFTQRGTMMDGPPHWWLKIQGNFYRLILYYNTLKIIYNSMIWKGCSQYEGRNKGEEKQIIQIRRTKITNFILQKLLSLWVVIPVGEPSIYFPNIIPGTKEGQSKSNLNKLNRCC